MYSSRDGDVVLSANPVTGREIDRFPVAGPEEMSEAMVQATLAAAWWQGLGHCGRGARLRGFASILARRLPDLAALISAETGKPAAEASVEIAAALEHLVWSARHARAELAPQRLGSSVLQPEHVAVVTYRPYGVVGVIGPWNYPVYTPLGAIGSALASGNVVIFKPSELASAVGQCLADWFGEVADGYAVLQCVHGGGETGQLLCGAGVGKLAFAGSSTVGRQVMATCAETLTPVVLECGGKDALLVLDDADLSAAVDACAWGAMTNAGQTCVGIKRVYAVDEVYSEFLRRLVVACRRLTVGASGTDLGPITAPARIATIRSQIEDALGRGARAALGGLESVRPPYVYPTILVDVPDQAPVVTEETFGPVLTVFRVSDAAEAVRRANATGFGLGGSVFSRGRGVRVARGLRVGMAAVNAVMSFAGAAAVPFGGVGESGFGRVHGAAGLREFSWEQTIVRRRFHSPLALRTFGRTAGTVSAMTAAVRLVHGGGITRWRRGHACHQGRAPGRRLPMSRGWSRGAVSRESG